MENSLIIILGENNFTADKNKTQTKNFIASKLLILLPKRGGIEKIECLLFILRTLLYFVLFPSHS